MKSRALSLVVVFASLFFFAGAWSPAPLVNTDWELMTATGRAPTGIETASKFGRNPDIDIGSAPEDVWLGGGLYPGQPETCPSEALEVFSSDPQDVFGGNGAQTLTMTFLDDDFERVTETVSMNGLGSVLTVSNGCRFLRGFVATAGSLGVNAGAITVRNPATTANIYAEIGAGVNQTQVGPFTVPAGHSAVIDQIVVAIARASGAPGSSEFRLLVRESNSVYRTRANYDLVTGGPFVLSYRSLPIYPERTDVIPRVISMSDNNTSIVFQMDYRLLEN